MTLSVVQKIKCKSLRRLVNNELERMKREATWHNIRYYPNNDVEGTRKTMKSTEYNSRSF